MTDSTRWGEVAWGAALLGESATGSTHILEAHAGAALRADASRLGIRHPISATIRVQSQALGAGAGPAPIHPLRATVVMPGANASATTLSFRHHLQASVGITLLAAPTNLTMGHKLAAGAIVTLDATGQLSIFHFLSSAFAVQLTAMATDLDLSHPLEALVQAALDAIGRIETTLPELAPIEAITGDPYQVVAGSYNLALNDSAEASSVGWDGEGGVTVERQLGIAWDGLWSVTATFPGSVVDEALVIRSLTDLRLAAWPGSQLLGSVWLASDAEIDVMLFLRSRYLDGTTLTSDAVTLTVDATGVLDDWEPALALPHLPDGSKTLTSFELVVQIVDNGVAELRADGVYLQYDPWHYGPAGVPVVPIGSELPADLLPLGPDPPVEEPVVEA